MLTALRAAVAVGASRESREPRVGESGESSVGEIGRGGSTGEARVSGAVWHSGSASRGVAGVAASGTVAANSSL